MKLLCIFAARATYAQLASRFLPLVRDADAWEELYDEDLGVLPAGALGTYAVRGWCRLEVVAGLAPKKFSDGDVPVAVPIPSAPPVEAIREGHD